MLFIRTAVISLSSPAPTDFDRGNYVASNGVSVEVLSVEGDHEDYTGAAGPPLGQMRLWGTFGANVTDSLSVWVGVTFSSKEPITQLGEGIVVPRTEVAAADEAIQEYADLLAVLNACVRRIHAPIASVGVRIESSEEAAAASGRPYYAAIDSHSADVTPSKLMPYVAPSRMVSLTADRLDGVALLAESLGQSTLTGRARGLFQFFERAFALGESKTIDVLTNFLTTGPANSSTRYSRAEVEVWMKVLRARSVHADGKRPYATDGDYVLHLARMEQAAYDVLWNKSFWREKGSNRRVGVDFAGALNEQGVLTVFSDRRGLAVHFDMRDQFNSFPLSGDMPAEVARDWTWLGAKPESQGGEGSAPTP